MVVGLVGLSLPLCLSHQECVLLCVKVNVCLFCCDNFGQVRVQKDLRRIILQNNFSNQENTAFPGEPLNVCIVRIRLIKS